MRSLIKGKNKIIFIFLVIAIISIFLGYFTGKIICGEDKFMLNGKSTIVLGLEQTYVDEGITAIAFGKDISNQVITITNINFGVPGQYYIKYTIKNIRFKGVEKYRIVIIEDIDYEK